MVKGEQVGVANTNSQLGRAHRKSAEGIASTPSCCYVLTLGAMTDVLRISAFRPIWSICAVCHSDDAIGWRGWLCSSRGKGELGLAASANSQASRDIANHLDGC